MATFPDPETTHLLPFRVSPLSSSIFFAKYTQPYPVASVRANDPPHFKDLPVNVPSYLFANFLYIPNIYPISLPPTPISPAGTSVFAPICLVSSYINAWQNAIISLSLLPLGSKSLPPFPPPI